MRLSISRVKSDNFRSNRPENQSRPLFSATADRNESGVGGPHPPEGGLSAGAGIGDDKWLGSRLNLTTSSAGMASERGIYA